jgi:hypothetical protein
MRGSLARRLRKAVYNEKLGNSNSRARMGMGKDVEEAYLYYTQRVVYQHAKTTIRRNPEASCAVVCTYASQLVPFLVDAHKNKLKADKEGKDALHNEGPQGAK